MVGSSPVAAMKIPWDPDTARRDCTQCNLPFTFFRRRHHCRSCGHLFCNECTKLRAPVLKWKITRRVRVCGTCFDEISGTKPRQSRGRSQTTSSIPALSKSVSDGSLTRSPPFRTRTPSPPRPPATSNPTISTNSSTLLSSPSAPVGSLHLQQQDQQPSLASPASPIRQQATSPTPSSGSFLNGLIGSHIRIAFTFVPESPVELAVSEGDTVLLIASDDDGTWIEGRFPDGRQGWFPSSYASLN